MLVWLTEHFWTRNSAVVDCTVLFPSLQMYTRCFLVHMIVCQRQSNELKSPGKLRGGPLVNKHTLTATDEVPLSNGIRCVNTVLLVDKLEVWETIHWDIATAVHDQHAWLACMSECGCVGVCVCVCMCVWCMCVWCGVKSAKEGWWCYIWSWWTLRTHNNMTTHTTCNSEKATIVMTTQYNSTIWKDNETTHDTCNSEVVCRDNVKAILVMLL